ncbi:response regulator transcription factor [Kurthia sibirica]|uniref:DNA-binding response regulator n=1 Tax=Kurthia sibirica TaxID=202750 RepID=A0A2U3AJ16_9BACL|nr:response regulator transcription factor [Kurthia sibirica]PWI24528.1 DNA-binding response regulator [Kurthia sibirica]GEK33597.1 DNA-binding response regulator [Kurthia sibirica]
MTAKIMIIEDDVDIIEVLQLYMEKEGYTVQVASTIEEGWAKISLFVPDVLLLDVNLPDGNGFELADRYRNISNGSLIFITGLNSEGHRLEGFDVGAGDYITKPFIPREVLARVKVNLRRNAGIEQKNFEQFGDLTVYYEQKEIFKQGELIPLFIKEKKLLFYLLENKGQILSLEQIIDHVWGVNGVEDTKIVSVNISTLRRKLENNPSKPQYIHTCRGYGYQFSCQ